MNNKPNPQAMNKSHQHLMISQIRLGFRICNNFECTKLYHINDWQAWAKFCHLCHKELMEK